MMAPSSLLPLIGTYKGVMLCNRPFGGSAAVQEGEGGKGESSGFICGTVKKPWGSNVTIPRKSRVISRIKKNDGALSKHKKWLLELQRRKGEKEQMKCQEQEEKEERKRKFMAKAAKKRSLARGFFQARQLYDQTDDDQEKPNNPSSSLEQDVLKPAWALTEQGAENVDNYRETQEEHELLNFVDDLDIERFADDLELKILMDQVRTRVKLLEQEKANDEKILNLIEKSEDRRLRDDEENNAYNGFQDICKDGEKHPENNDDDLQSIADTVMSEVTMKSIHSQLSMKHLVSKAREKLDNSCMEPIAEVETCFKAPALVIHTDDDGARLEQRKSLNKLPFKNRNPAL